MTALFFSQINKILALPKFIYSYNTIGVSKSSRTFVHETYSKNRVSIYRHSYRILFRIFYRSTECTKLGKKIKKLTTYELRIIIHLWNISKWKSLPLWNLSFFLHFLILKLPMNQRLLTLSIIRMMFYTLGFDLSVKRRTYALITKLPKQDKCLFHFNLKSKLNMTVRLIDRFSITSYYWILHLQMLLVSYRIKFSISIKVP